MEVEWVFILFHFILFLPVMYKTKQSCLQKSKKQPVAKHGCRHNWLAENCGVIYLGFCVRCKNPRGFLSKSQDSLELHKAGVRGCLDDYKLRIAFTSPRLKQLEFRFPVSLYTPPLLCILSRRGTFKAKDVSLLLCLILHKSLAIAAKLMSRMTVCLHQQSDHFSRREPTAVRADSRWKEGLSLLPILGNDSEINVEVKKSRW